jgi:MinD-like ATPase involved in chromosome partitioning or flagellar assembly
MPDQAAGLRSLFARRRPSLLIVAGDDASKAAVAVHFAREAAAGGRATVLIDGTPGDIAMACNLSCRYELAHVLTSDKPLADVLRALTPHLLVLPAARALSRFGSFTADEESRLGEAFSTGIAQALATAGAAETQVDLIVVNAGAMQAVRAVEAFGRDARVVLVARDQPGSLRGAYVELKALSQVPGLENFEIVVPRFTDDAATGVAFTNLSNAARRFLDIELTDGGTLTVAPPREPAVIGARVTTPTRAAPEDAAAAVTSDSGASSSPPSIDEVPHAAAVA